LGKREILAQYPDHSQTSKCWSKNRNSGQKSKFFSKIEILVKNRNFGQKSKLWPKIEILVKKQNYDEKSTFCSKIFAQNF